MHESPTLPRPLVLGSTSRYRRELLSRLNLPFDVAAPEVDETPHDREPPKELALRLALAKARAVAALRPTAVVIGSDQVADLAGHPLGKPGNHEKATQQLQTMSGQTVIFQTAVAVVCAETGFEQVDLAPVEVKFRPSAPQKLKGICAQKSPTTAQAAPKAKGWASACWTPS